MAQNAKTPRKSRTSAYQIKDSQDWLQAILQELFDSPKFDSQFLIGQSKNDQKVILDNWKSELIPALKEVFEELPEEGKHLLVEAVDSFIKRWEWLKELYSRLDDPSAYQGITLHSLIKDAVEDLEYSLVSNGDSKEKSLLIALLVHRPDYTGGFQPLIQSQQEGNFLPVASNETVPDQQYTTSGRGRLLSDAYPCELKTWADVRQAVQECCFGRDNLATYYSLPSQDTEVSQLDRIAYWDNRFLSLFGRREDWLKLFTKGLTENQQYWLGLEFSADCLALLEQPDPPLDKNNLVYQNFWASNLSWDVYRYQKRAELRKLNHDLSLTVFPDSALDDLDRKFRQIEFYFATRAGVPENNHHLTVRQLLAEKDKAYGFFLALYIITNYPSFPEHLPKASPITIEKQTVPVIELNAARPANNGPSLLSFFNLPSEFDWQLDFAKVAFPEEAGKSFQGLSDEQKKVEVTALRDEIYSKWNDHIWPMRLQSPFYHTAFQPDFLNSVAGRFQRKVEWLCSRLKNNPNAGLEEWTVMEILREAVIGFFNSESDVFKSIPTESEIDGCCQIAALAFLRGNVPETDWYAKGLSNNSFFSSLGAYVSGIRSQKKPDSQLSTPQPVTQTSRPINWGNGTSLKLTSLNRQVLIFMMACPRHYLTIQDFNDKFWEAALEGETENLRQSIRQIRKAIKAIGFTEEAIATKKGKQNKALGYGLFLADEEIIFLEEAVKSCEISSESNH